MFVAVLSVLGAVAYQSVTSSRETAAQTKLSADTAHVNEVLQIYLANGGTLPASYTPSAVMSSLKTRADAASSATTMGLTSSYLDPRTVAVEQTDAEAASSQVRAVWSGSGYAVVAGPGPKGIKEFQLDDTLSSQAPSTDSRDPGVLKTGTATGWVWDYTDRAPTSVASGTTPATGNRSSYAAGAASNASPLPAPTVPNTSVPLLSFGNSGYSVSITDNSPSGSSQLYYALSTGSAYTLYRGAFSIDPGTAITAYAKSIDPDHYSDSAVASGSITVQKVTLDISLSLPSSLTYAQAGGAMTVSSTTAPVASVTLNNASSIPTRYISSSKFQTYSGYDSSSLNPATVTFAGTYVSPQISLNISNWASGATGLGVSAQLRSLDSTLFNSSNIASGTVAIAKTTLSAPTVTPASGYLANPVQMAMTDADYPVGARIYYTLDGSDPGASAAGEPTSSTATKYTGTFSPTIGSGGSITVIARAYGPSGYGQWFNPSNSTAMTYTSYIDVEGAVVNSASINGTFVGSLIWGSAPSNGTIQFNSGAKIVDGNVYVPGLPEIRFQPPTTTVVQAGVAVVQPTSSLPRSVVAGKDITSDGTIITSSTDTRQIVDLNGDTSPSNYRVNLDSSASIEGKIFRRSTAPPLPSVAVPTGLTNYGGVSGSQTLLPGRYTSVTANGGDVMTIGTAGGTTPQIYEFDALNLNSGSKINVVGPVIVYLTTNPSISGTFGNSAHPEYLQLDVSVAGNFNMNSSAALYAKLVAPLSNVTLNNIFVGSVVANSLSVNGSGVAFTLPPVIGG